VRRGRISGAVGSLKSPDRCKTRKDYSQDHRLKYSNLESDQRRRSGMWVRPIHCRKET